MNQPWDIPSAISLYNIDRWGTGYFGINDRGHLNVMPTQDTRTPIDMVEVLEEAKSRGLTFPMVLRFQDLLRHRVEQINRAFGDAIT
jgi:arginine decarboxylase